jgi:hypothetical protein
MNILEAPKTNGDLVAPYVERGKFLAREAVSHVREHPDELAVAVIPFVLLTLATRRHRLGIAEAALVSQVAIWSGIFAVRAYQDWKAQDAAPALRSVR